MAELFPMRAEGEEYLRNFFAHREGERAAAAICIECDAHTSNVMMARWRFPSPERPVSFRQRVDTGEANTIHAICERCSDEWVRQSTRGRLVRSVGTIVWRTGTLLGFGLMLADRPTLARYGFWLTAGFIGLVVIGVSTYLVGRRMMRRSTPNGIRGTMPLWLTLATMASATRETPTTSGDPVGQ